MTGLRPVAVIVAGGFGTRLLPLTTHRPKHLLEVAGVPFLEHQLTRLAEAGVQDVVLATSYHADLFEPVLGDGSAYGVRLSYVREEEPLGTGGAIRNVLDSLGDQDDRPVIIFNGDVVSGHDLTAQLKDFEEPRDGEQVRVSLHLVEVPDARAFGCVPTDESGRVLDFVEKSEHPPTRQINAGCYIFRRSEVAAIPAGRVVSVERETFPGLVESGALVVGYVESTYWRDVGTPEALVATSADLVLGVGSSPAVQPSPSGASISPHASVSADAEVSSGSCVSARVRVQAGAVVRGSVIMPGASIGAATVLDSVVGPCAVVEDGALVKSAAIGDEATIRAGAVVGAGERVDCGTTR